MNFEELKHQVSDLIPHRNWGLTKGSGENFYLWSDGLWLAVNKPAEYILWALENPEEFEAELDQEIADYLANQQQRIEAQGKD